MGCGAIRSERSRNNSWCLVVSIPTNSAPFHRITEEFERKQPICQLLLVVSGNIQSYPLPSAADDSLLFFFNSFFFLFQNNPLENSLKFIPIMIYLMCVLAQILVNCYFGSRLSYKSDEITHAIYTSPWMDRNEKCKRVVRILVERSRRPMTIYAGGVFELSLQTFLRVKCQ